MDSIRRLGLLQPITITPEGLLLCGARRLEAARRLGMREISVWVRAGISGRLEQLLAEQHDNAQRKELTPIEAAGLYREMKALISEDNARRQQRSRFQSEAAATDRSGRDGPVDSTAPDDRTSRSRAAQFVTGRNGYTRLEQVGRLQRIAEDPTIAETVRERAESALAAIERDGTVNGHYQSFLNSTADPSEPRTPGPGPRAPFEQQQAGEAAGGRPVRPPVEEDRGLKARRRAVRAFWLVWGELGGWDRRFDPVEIGRGLNAEQWAEFEAIVTATTTFLDAARQARDTIQAA